MGYPPQCITFFIHPSVCDTLIWIATCNLCICIMYVYVICKYIVYVYYVCVLCMICILSCISVLYIFIYPSILPYVCTLCVYYVCMQSMCLYICIVYLLCISCIFILSKFVCPSTHLSSVCPCILDTMQVYYISN